MHRFFDHETFQRSKKKFQGKSTSFPRKARMGQAPLVSQYSALNVQRSNLPCAIFLSGRVRTDQPVPNNTNPPPKPGPARPGSSLVRERESSFGISINVSLIFCVSFGMSINGCSCRLSLIIDHSSRFLARLQRAFSCPLPRANHRQFDLYQRSGDEPFISLATLCRLY